MKLSRIAKLINQEGAKDEEVMDELKAYLGPIDPGLWRSQEL